MLAGRSAALTAGSSKNKSNEIIELDSDSDLDLEEPEQISSNYLDFEFEQIDTIADDCAVYDEDLSNSSLGDNNSNENSKTVAATIEDSSTTVEKRSTTPSKTLNQTAVANLPINSSVNISHHATLTDLQDTQINPKIAEICNSTTTSSEQQQQHQQSVVTPFTMPRIIDSYTWRRNSIHISSSPTNNNETDITSAERNSDESDEIDTDGECTNKCARTKQFIRSKVIFSQTPTGSLQQDAIDFDVEEDMALNTRPASCLLVAMIF